MRTVYLTPDHSSWWLLSPGITLYFDKLCITEKDHQKLIARAGDSSYHQELLRRYELLTKKGETEIQIINDKEVQSDAVEIGISLANNLIETARINASDRDNPEFIDPLQLVSLARNSFQNWIHYNERKLKYLRGGEPMHRFMSDQLASWRNRLHRFNQILDLKSDEAKSDEVLSRFLDDKELLSTFIRLVVSATRCIKLADKGLRIYDPMLVSYMPMIELLERHMSVLTPEDSSIIDSLNAHNFRMARYLETIPVEIGDGLLRTIKQFKYVRHKLEQLDEAFRSLESQELISLFKPVNQEIAKLLREAELASKITEYVFWGVGLKFDIFSWLGLPIITDKLKSVAGTLSLIKNRVGTFAGFYASIAKHLLAQQDSIKYSSTPGHYLFNPTSYTAHYKNFIDREAGDTNAI